MKRYPILGLAVLLLTAFLTMGATCGGDGGNGATQPTATQLPAEPTATQEANPAATASSLDFTVEVELEGQGTATYRYRARNIGTSSLDFRIDMDMQGMTLAYILKGSTQEGWVYDGQQWIAFSQMYLDWDAFWDAWYDGWDSYHASLVDEWAGQGTWTYTVPGVGSVTYKNIVVNPTLPDSVFQP